MKDYLSILREDLPNGQEMLCNTCNELTRVVEYCTGSYEQATNKQQALEQTMIYASQSLGSVACQINGLATSFLDVLDQQSSKLLQMEGKINQLNMQVTVHQEKVARRSIGSYTAARDPPYDPQRASSRLPPIPQDVPGESTVYAYRTIDYSILDHLGHGVRPQEPQSSVVPGSSQGYATVLRSNSVSERPPVNPAALNERPQPPAKVAGGTLGRSVTTISGAQFRAATIAPPKLTGLYEPTWGSQTQQPPPAAAGTLPYTGSGAWIHNPATPSVPYASTSILIPAPAQFGATSYLTSGLSDSSDLLSMPAPPSPPSPAPMMMPPPPCEPGYIRRLSRDVAEQLAISGRQTSTCMLPPPPSEPSQLPPPPAPKFAMQDDCMHSLPPPPMAPPALNSDYGPDGLHYQESLVVSCVSPAAAPQTVTDAFYQVSYVPGTMKSKTAADPVWAPDFYLQKVYTLFDYTQDKDDELTFTENCIIYVLKENDDGWWEGVMENGSKGLFPGNYVMPTP